MPGSDRIEGKGFVLRRRYDLDVLRAGDHLLVRKAFRGDRRAWSRELSALVRLDEAGVAAPRLLAVDGRSTTIVKTLIAGPTLRQRLVEAGARILSVDTEPDAELSSLGSQERLQAVWARGRQALSRVDSDGSLQGALEAQMNRLHRAGLSGFSLTLGNVVLEESTGAPVFIDFDSATVHKRASGVLFAAGRDRDRRLFDRIYGTVLLNEARAGRLLEAIGRTNYAPLDLGDGLVTRGFWSVDSGTGRWELLNSRALAPLLPGARVLDLGSHNGVMPLLMLRDGAREVIAVERQPELVAAASQLRDLFEWRYIRPFSLRLLEGEMLETIREQRGEFDLVTAFCSLYYLEPGEMAEVVRRAATLSPVLVLQAKTDTRQEAADNKAEKSNLGFLADLMRQNGFPHVTAHAPTGYSRPLLVGRRS